MPRTLHSSLINRLVWSLWLWFSWGLPVLFLLMKWGSGTGGWEMLLITLVSPVLIPAYALLTALPRFILRRKDRARSAAPTLVSVLMILHWWSFTMMVQFLRGIGDTGSTDSLMSMSMRWIPENFEAAIATVGLILASVTWLAALAVSAGYRPRAQPTTAATRLWSHTPWSHTPWLAVVAPPLTVALILGSMYSANLDGVVDAAGNTERQVSDMEAADVRALQIARWDETQSQIVPLRQSIAPDGWRAIGGLLNPGEAGINHDSSLESFRPLGGGYNISATWDHAYAGAIPSASNELKELAESLGWTVEMPRRPDTSVPEIDPLRDAFAPEAYLDVDDEGRPNYVRYQFSNADGYSLTISTFMSIAEQDTKDDTHTESGSDDNAEAASADPALQVSLQVTSPNYWREDPSPVDWADGLTRSDVEAAWSEDAPLFAADAWPDLALAEANFL